MPQPFLPYTMLRQQSPFQVIAFKNSASKKTHAACTQCRKGHRKCGMDEKRPPSDPDKRCARCTKLNTACSLDPAYTALDPSTAASSPIIVARTPDLEPPDAIFKNENIYAKMLEKKLINSQYITSTQPLAPIFSKDSILCLDGEVLGLYSPWRDVNIGLLGAPDGNELGGAPVDADLQYFLARKGAFELPPKEEQRRLVGLFFENGYPLMPIVEREMDLEKTPLLLLNCLMLAGIRYDQIQEKDREQCRIKAHQLMRRAKYLEMMESNKVTLLQAYLLLSHQEEGPEGPVLSREYIFKACMLVVELGIHNLGESNNLDGQESIKDSKYYVKSIFKRKYDRRLLTRIFWSTFCCDRYICVTTGSAMTMNPRDLIMDPLSIDDFKEGKNQREDYSIFKRWYSLCLFFDRILCNAYRPPGRRDVDETLESDLIKWDTENLGADAGHLQVKYLNFFKITHSYCNLLYLRCQIGVLNLIETESDLIHVDPTILTPLSFAGMKFTVLFCTRILDTLTENMEGVQHIVNVHAVLHAMVLIHLEMEVKCQTSAGEDGGVEMRQLLKQKVQQIIQGLKILERQRVKWWLAGAAFHIFDSLLKKLQHQLHENGSSGVDFNENNSNHDESHSAMDDLTKILDNDTLISELKPDDFHDSTVNETFRQMYSSLDLPQIS